MNKILSRKTIAALCIGILTTTIATSVQATLTCNSWSSGGSSGQNIYNCNFYSGNTSGSYVSSYLCYNNTYRGYCTISYKGGNTYEGACSIVFKCSDGSNYYCNLNNWDGKETIQCDYIPRNCQEIQVVCPKIVTSIPEPASVVAAALLLLPFGISTARILRNRRVKQII